MRLVTASALRAASFGGRRLLPASGTDGAYPSLSKLRHLCYNTAILEIGDSCLTFGAWSNQIIPPPLLRGVRFVQTAAETAAEITVRTKPNCRGAAAM